MEWLGSFVTVVIALVSTGVVWGLLKGDVKALRERVERAERDLDGKASRESVGGLEKQLEQLRTDIMRRLDRIEELLRSR